MIRIVADTNIYISGIFWPGLNRLVLNLARHEVLSLVCSPSVVKELYQTLQGKKFGLTEAETDTLIGDLLTYTTPVQEPLFSHPTLRDPKDNFLCSLAMKSRAAYLITGDKDLLILKRVGSARIVTAREFLEREFLELLEVYDDHFTQGVEEEAAIYATPPKSTKKVLKHAKA